MPPVGILAMAYGSPLDRQDILRYYTDIRRGRPPTPEQLAELTARYDAIGGSPLREITFRQAEGLAERLRRTGTLPQAKAYVGLRHSPPTIAEAVARMAADGVEDAVLLVLAPHYSTMSVQVYLDAAEAAARAEGRPVRWRSVKSWHDHPRYVAFLADELVAARARLAPWDDEEIAYVFTAHSLPERIVAAGDPYPRLLAETALLVQERLSLPNTRTAWQSRGRTEEPWLGPDILEVLRQVADDGYRGVLVVPCGFVADHLEVLYDLDIEAAAAAAALGLAFARTAMGNDRPAFLDVLAAVVTDAWVRS